jgi:hypothetical protein
VASARAYGGGSCHASSSLAASWIAVSRNLGRGQAIIAVVGDGIREDLEPFAELLQTHAGHRFTFALVELAIYETADKLGRIVTPSVLAKTALIERGVVHIAEGDDGTRKVLVGASQPAIPGASKPRQMSLGEDEFYEILDQRDPGISAVLKEFLNKADRARNNGRSQERPSNMLRLKVINLILAR